MTHSIDLPLDERLPERSTFFGDGICVRVLGEIPPETVGLTLCFDYQPRRSLDLLPGTFYDEACGIEDVPVERIVLESEEPVRDWWNFHYLDAWEDSQREFYGRRRWRA